MTRRVARSEQPVRPGAVEPENASPELRSRGVPRRTPIILFAVFMAVIARQGTRAISDPDAFWHLRLGNDIIESRSLTEPTEAWSTISDQRWVPTQWLTEVVAATFHRWFGLPGVAFLFAAALLVLVVLVHRLCRRESGNVAAAFVTGLAIVGMSASLSPRPHMVTYVFLAVTLLAWLGTIDDLRPRWWLIPLSWVWAMCHGMWFTGAALGLAVTLGILADRRLDRTRALSLLAVPALSVLVAALTPVGPGLLLAPFAVAGVGEFITEWQAPSFRAPGPAAAMALVLLVVLVWARRGQRTPWSRVALLVLGVAWVLLAQRTVTLGALLLAPLAASALQQVLDRPRDVPTRAESRVIIGWALACLAGVAMVLPATASNPAGVPSALDDQLAALPDGSVILNSYELGGWLRWRHPDLEPVIDGMTEAYSVPYLQGYAQISSAAPGWESVLDAYDAHYALLSERSPLSAALLDRQGWSEVDRSGGYLLLRAPS